VEELLARTMEVAVTLKLIAKKELTRVIVDSTVQEKAVAHPTDSKLLETARPSSTPNHNFPLFCPSGLNKIKHLQLML
jgi:hypothetical protein